MTTGATKKVGFSEEDVSLLLQRYSPAVILTLLQEVSQVADVSIDWSALVKRTATGITNAREYQMLWRHLAYHHALLEKTDDAAEPLDDESDLELEIEAVPAASGEALSEAAACVKVLISCGLPREPGPTNRTNLEAPLAVNISSDQRLHLPSDKQLLSRVNHESSSAITSLQKQPLPAGTFAHVSDGNDKKRRRTWTEEEDMEIISAGQKFGERNWANTIKGDHQQGRNASQRWSVIRKHDANSLAGSSNKSASSTRSEERLAAAQKAISLALDVPKSAKLSAVLSGGTQLISAASSSAPSAVPSEGLPVSTQPLNQLREASTPATSKKMIVNTLNKSRTTQKKSMALVKPSTGPSSLIQAAAFAAGGRIATPSTAASLFKAAQSKNAVHIRPRGGSQSSTINNVKSLAVTNTTGLQPASVHFSRPAITMAVQPPENAVSSSATCVRHGGQQAQGCFQGVTNNPPDTVSHEMADLSERKDDIDISAIDVDEILAADIKYASEMESDDIMADEPQTDLLNLVTDATEDNDAEANVDKQKDLPSDAKTTENKALEVHDNGDNTSVEKGTASFNAMVGNTSPVEKLDSQNHIINQEQLTGVEIMADEVKKGCNEANQHALPEDTASGSKRHATNDCDISTNDKQ
ncbi:unnamed protein product [Musa acuminata var. zebrina]